MHELRFGLAPSLPGSVTGVTSMKTMTRSQTEVDSEAGNSRSLRANLMSPSQDPEAKLHIPQRKLSVAGILVRLCVSEIKV